MMFRYGQRWEASSRSDQASRYVDGPVVRIIQPSPEERLTSIGVTAIGTASLSSPLPVPLHPCRVADQAEKSPASAFYGSL